MTVLVTVVGLSTVLLVLDGILETQFEKLPGDITGERIYDWSTSRPFQSDRVLDS